MGDVLDRSPQPRQAETDEHQSRHDRGHSQPADSVLLHDVVNDHDKGSRGSTYLYPRAAERRNEEARHDRGIEATLG